MMVYDVVIAGGGLSGSALAILLSRAGFSVAVRERVRYPVHRLCGEFLSPEVQHSFERLGVMEALDQAGAVRLSRGLLTSGGVELPLMLPGNAIGVSRYVLDALLFERAREAGADARDGCRVTGIHPAENGFIVQTSEGELEATLVVGAFGKRSNLDGALKRPFVQQQTPWVGFKAHFTGYSPGDAIELHLYNGGYCGMSFVEREQVNVCWLCDAHLLKEAGNNADALLALTGEMNPALGERVRQMTRLSEKFEAVSQVTFVEKGFGANGLFMAGDATAMIPPLCGDGMAMALSGAELLADLLPQVLRGTLDVASAHVLYERQWREQFATRMRVGRLLNPLLTKSRVATPLLRTGRLFPALAGWFVHKTRGAV